MTHHAIRLSILVEQLLEDRITAILSEAGVRGWSVFKGAGAGMQGSHPADPPRLVGAFGLVRIDAILADRDAAERIAQTVSDRFFEDHAGVVTLEPIEVLRPGLFGGA